MKENPYFLYASTFEKMHSDGKNLPLGGLPFPSKPKVSKDAPVILIMSPHPDDECIIGGLPLRLMEETGVRVVNVAVTLGSKPERKKERLEELRQACEWIGFELEETGPHGLEGITPQSRNQDPGLWKESVNLVTGILEKWNPAAVFFPHARDWNSTHIGVHQLTTDALRQMPAGKTMLIETEYWGQMQSPNLMVEISGRQLGSLLSALSFHRGELVRNPFHIRLPGWMQDNVRRGTELVGGQGGTAPDFSFATLYRVSRWNRGEVVPAWDGGKTLAIREDSRESLFPS
jgi:LmbE family N-acetylglucosaminyl deacetylase